MRRRSRSSAPNPRPSSATSSRAVESAYVDLDRDSGGVGIRDHVPNRLLGHAIDERLRVGIEAVDAVEPQLDLRPPRGEWTDEVTDRRFEAGRRESRWMQVDEQRSQIAHGGPEAIDHASHDRGVRVCSP